MAGGPIARGGRASTRCPTAMPAALVGGGQLESTAVVQEHQDVVQGTVMVPLAHEKKTQLVRHCQARGVARVYHRPYRREPQPLPVPQNRRSTVHRDRSTGTGRHTLIVP